MTRRSILLTLLVGLFLSGQSLRAQVRFPAPPDVIDVFIRFRIDVLKLERAKQFLAMKDYFESLGFKRFPKDAQMGKDFNETLNPVVDRMVGSIPTKNVRKLLLDPRVKIVQTIPDHEMVPAPDSPVRVELRLSQELSGAAQQQLFETLLNILEQYDDPTNPPKPFEIAFRNGVGYEHFKHTRIVGSALTGKTSLIFDDVRLTPPAWSLLSPRLLTDLRRAQGGQALVKEVLLEWNQIPEGSALIAAVLQQWEKTPAGAARVQDFHPTVNQFPEVRQEQLLKHLADHADAQPYLQDLLEKVFQSPAGPKLMQRLVPRLTRRQFRNVVPLLYQLESPIQIVELHPDWPIPKTPGKITVPPSQRKLSPGVRNLIGDANARDETERFEIILNYVPREATRFWQQNFLRALPGLIIEGIAGPYVTVRCKASETPVLAELGEVSIIRLPRRASSGVIELSPEPVKATEVLQKTGLARFHDQKARGKGIRLAVIDSDFRGWEKFKGKGLPESTTLVDFTIERNPSLVGDPPAGPADELGSGTNVARAVALAAPEAEITLVRVDPSSSYHTYYALQQIIGTPLTAETRRTRRDELLATDLQLEAEKQALLERRDKVLSLFPDNRAPDPNTQKQEIDKQAQVRQYFLDQADFDRRLREEQQKTQRLLDHVNSVRAMEGIDMVVSNLSWSSGYPVDNSGFLSRFLEDNRPKNLTWIQSVGNVENQTWVELFRDKNKNGVMEFSDSAAPLPEGSWTSELNFLTWKPWEGEAQSKLPANTKVRVTLQWHEAHDPRYVRQGEDPFRVPLSKFKVLVMQQFDPQGELQPSDDLAIVAQSAEEALAQRVQRSRNGATYEYSITFNVPKPARYAIRIEGIPPENTQPRGEAVFPLGTRIGEMKPRLVVETIAGNGGHVIPEVYRTNQGEITTPADTRRVIAIGAANFIGASKSYSAKGPLYRITLRNKPDAIFPDRLGLSDAESVGGSGMAAGLAAGYAAVLRSAGHKPKEIYGLLRLAEARMRSNK